MPTFSCTEVKSKNPDLANYDVSVEDPDENICVFEKTQNVLPAEPPVVVARKDVLSEEKTTTYQYIDPKDTNTIQAYKTPSSIWRVPGELLFGAKTSDWDKLRRELFPNGLKVNEAQRWVTIQNYCKTRQISVTELKKVAHDITQSLTTRDKVANFEFAVAKLGLEKEKKDWSDFYKRTISEKDPKDLQVRFAKLYFYCVTEGVSVQELQTFSNYKKLEEAKGSALKLNLLDGFMKDLSADRSYKVLHNILFPNGATTEQEAFFSKVKSYANKEGVEPKELFAFVGFVERSSTVTAKLNALGAAVFFLSLKKSPFYSASNEVTGEENKKYIDQVLLAMKRNVRFTELTAEDVKAWGTENKIRAAYIYVGNEFKFRGEVLDFSGQSSVVDQYYFMHEADHCYRDINKEVMKTVDSEFRAYVRAASFVAHKFDFTSMSESQFNNFIRDQFTVPSNMNPFEASKISTNITGLFILYHKIHHNDDKALFFTEQLKAIIPTFHPGSQSTVPYNGTE